MITTRGGLELGLALVAVCGACALGFLSWRTARSLASAVGLQTAAEHDLRILTREVEDRVRQRNEEMERAARIQRQLLPQAMPEIEGYELAATCRPAQDVAGDFYDWVVSGNGHLDVTVADVMGKGIGAALVMATLRTALRTAPSELGPAARVRLVAESIALGGDDGLFVTLFHARLDLESGRLRYVDAGHGYCAIRRASGEFDHFVERSLPVGVSSQEPFYEGTARLGPGDTLIVSSDGLVETERGTVPLAEIAQELDESGDAREVVARLMGRMPACPPDDVTLLVLRRVAEGSTVEQDVRPPPPRATGVLGAAPEVIIDCEAIPEQLDRVHEALAQFWLGLGSRPGDTSRMLFELAVAEVAANIIEHGRPPTMSLRLTADAGSVIAVFTYAGTGWTDTQPTFVHPLAERGRGLFLARTGVDQVAYRRAGTTVQWRLVKRL
jgi:serine phosphatase RsbU (regulator of sigma subunit)/anti-sigma regulatory factor (Ser/Thr protein kinase)